MIGLFLVAGLICSSKCEDASKADEIRLISSCPFNKVGEWNRRNIRNELAMWWSSITLVFGSEGLPVSYYNKRSQEFVNYPTDFTVLTLTGTLDNGEKVIWQEYDESSRSGIFVGNSFTGDNLTYIYEDFKTTLVGRFDSGEFVEGVEAVIIAERCNMGIKQIKTKIKNPDQIWEFDEQGIDYIGANPTVLDPFERKSVYVGESQLAGGGDGLFAKRNFLPGELVSYFGGLKTFEEYFLFSNQSTEEYWDAHSYYIELSDMSPSRWNVPKDTVIDIPQKYRSLVNYRHTLAHKINHQFVGTNTNFDVTLHPFNGPLACVIATRPIYRGEELFVNYNYNVNHAPTWYRQLYMEQRKLKAGSRNSNNFISKFFNKDV